LVTRIVVDMLLAYTTTTSPLFLSPYIRLLMHIMIFCHGSTWLKYFLNKIRKNVPVCQCTKIISIYFFVVFRSNVSHALMLIYKHPDLGFHENAFFHFLENRQRLVFANIFPFEKTSWLKWKFSQRNRKYSENLLKQWTTFLNNFCFHGNFHLKFETFHPNFKGFLWLISLFEIPLFGNLWLWNIGGKEKNIAFGIKTLIFFVHFLENYYEIFCEIVENIRVKRK